MYLLHLWPLQVTFPLFFYFAFPGLSGILGFHICFFFFFFNKSRLAGQPGIWESFLQVRSRGCSEWPGRWPGDQGWSTSPDAPMLCPCGKPLAWGRSPLSLPVDAGFSALALWHFGLSSSLLCVCMCVKDVCAVLFIADGSQHPCLSSIASPGVTTQNAFRHLWMSPAGEGIVPRWESWL